MQAHSARLDYLRALRASSQYRWFRIALLTGFILALSAAALTVLGGLAMATLLMVGSAGSVPSSIAPDVALGVGVGAGLAVLLYTMFLATVIMILAFMIFTPLQMLADFLDMRIDAAASGEPAGTAGVAASARTHGAAHPTPTSPPGVDPSPTHAPQSAAPVPRQPTIEDRASALLAQAREAFARGDHAQASKLLNLLRERFPTSKAAASVRT
ncbi:MAG: hypothetical protein O2819_04395 [Planctomycetota bacterium]|nr:hypothetical protein [Planctomycetota bacterium]MDA1106713.1 hypothetical protein [Planctomycetota bacterium]